ncbi:MAG TPA: thiamine phosphate synthase [Kofleriaceae bacterium]|nr:thiamine phosphate synthase [Kofleriaceae bacterium]
MTVRDAIRGFYAVLDRDDEALARVLAAHSRVLQVRIKPRGRLVDTAELVRIARMARRVCDDAGIALVVNDRVDVALAVAADGVHLGQTDLPVEAARRVAGDRLWIGVSTHDLQQVREACAAGADYLGFGPVFATATKQNPDPVQGISMLARAVEAADGRPVVAIGGITPAAAAAVYATGVQAICAISAVNDAADRSGAARALGSAPTSG